jgi:hypothetical protein
VGDMRGFRVNFGGAFFVVAFVKYNNKTKSAERENGGCSRIE